MIGQRGHLVLIQNTPCLRSKAGIRLLGLPLRIHCIQKARSVGCFSSRSVGTMVALFSASWQIPQAVA